MKKKLIILSVALTAGLLAGAAAEWTAKDAARLQKGILTTGAPAEYDMDGSGEVDVVDLVLLKRAILAEKGETVMQNVPATADHVRFQSRTVQKDDIAWLVQSGAAAECIITAESASVTLAGSSGIYNGEDFRPRYGVYVDGELVADTLMSETEETVTLWEGKNRTAEVKVMLLSEAMYGGVGVKSFDVNSAAAIPVKPVPERVLSIEFIGDSITCAYGVEGTSSSDPFKISTENFSKSYAYLAAQQLGADYSTCCYSGYGITSGYTSDGTKNSESLIPDCYEMSSKFADYRTDWDFENARQHDAVVINLGTNDINYVAADPETRNAEFIEEYKAFLTTIREKNPQAAIICTVGTMGGDEIYALIEQAVEEFGDERVSCFFSKTHTMADGMGSDWHPSTYTQQNSAYVMADKICQALGIESDQIGIDVAADAEYDMVAANGANAWPYVGYDKSFSISTVTGGSDPSDVEGVLSGIGLKEDGKYVLSFDLSAPADAEFPVLVRGRETYFSGTAVGGAEDVHFEEEFTASATDTVQIVFQVGGRDSLNVILKNIKLTKVG